MEAGNKPIRHVYLAVNAEGLIKIGISGKVYARMRTLKTTLLGAFRGTFSDEKVLHFKLQSHRVTGEWYRDSPEFRREIAGLFLAPVRIDQNLLLLPWPGEIEGLTQSERTLAALHRARKEGRIAYQLTHRARNAALILATKQAYCLSNKVLLPDRAGLLATPV